MIKVKKVFDLSVRFKDHQINGFEQVLDNCKVNLRRFPEFGETLHNGEKYTIAIYECDIESERFEGFVDYLEECLDEDIDITVLC